MNEMEIRNRLNNLDARLRRIENIFTPENKVNNLNVLGDAKVKRINSTVRIKDVKLVYPTLTEKEMANSANTPSTLVVIPKDNEILDEISKAYKSAYEYGITSGKFNANFTFEQLKSNKKESVFLDGAKFISEQKPDIEEFLKEVIGDGLLMRNVKVGVDNNENYNIVLRDSKGNLLGPDDKLSTGDVGEIVINFYPYNYKNKLGVSRYIQGFIVKETKANFRSLFI
ncbi:MAG: DUF2815 family protein [Peptoniphilus rhinitidis]|uniref:ssDNA-binding protein n=1 Tax=Peptoniphilus rhinitidis TaxID=1175452 RepID=UPI002903047B|nr:ssDNA-binding protein [Peptoniphilus rhinitidis]MDU2108971.1 DUF2815 family protein [Peptoniphilus lacydonensis]MDU3750178.1 DUF2815 family protein [Peptoniphilus rhinitidis]